MSLNDESNVEINSHPSLFNDSDFSVELGRKKKETTHHRKSLTSKVSLDCYKITKTQDTFQHTQNNHQMEKYNESRRNALKNNLTPEKEMIIYDTIMKINPDFYKVWVDFKCGFDYSSGYDILLKQLKNIS